MLVLLMTDAAVDNFVKGKMELGGTGASRSERTGWVSPVPVSSRAGSK